MRGHFSRKVRSCLAHVKWKLGNNHMYVIRPDLVKEGLFIPSTNTNQYYGVEDVARLKHVHAVNENYEPDEDGCYECFYAPEGHVVFLYSMDLEWVA